MTDPLGGATESANSLNPTVLDGTTSLSDRAERRLVTGAWPGLPSTTPTTCLTTTALWSPQMKMAASSPLSPPTCTLALCDMQTRVCTTPLTRASQLQLALLAHSKPFYALVMHTCTPNTAMYVGPICPTLNKGSALGRRPGGVVDYILEFSPIDLSPEGVFSD